VLNLQAVDALKLLENIPQIQQKLATLVEVGLGYVTLGQSATTLSGGEAQRIKLARELSKRQTGRTLYILDEPTTGLHFDDVRKLLDVLQRLVSLGNTVLIIEHHLDVIKQADWVIDLGPEGGEGGGRIVAQGSPELIARSKKSYTGQALLRVLNLPGHTNGNGNTNAHSGGLENKPQNGQGK
jgi:excinuclease ABC subunit A